MLDGGLPLIYGWCLTKPEYRLLDSGVHYRVMVVFSRHRTSRIHREADRHVSWLAVQRISKIFRNKIYNNTIKIDRCYCYYCDHQIPTYPRLYQTRWGDLFFGSKNLNHYGSYWCSQYFTCNGMSGCAMFFFFLGNFTSFPIKLCILFWSSWT